MTEERQPDEVLKKKVREFAAEHGALGADGYLAMNVIGVKFGGIVGFAAAFAEQQLAEARAQAFKEAAEIAQNFSDDRLCERIAGAIERAAEAQKEHVANRFGKDWWEKNRKVMCTCGHFGSHHDPEEGNCETGPPCESRCMMFDPRDMCNLEPKP